MVHMDDARDFLRVNVLNTSDYPKQLTDQAGYVVYIYIYIEPLSTKLYMDMHIESIMYCTNFVVCHRFLKG